MAAVADSSSATSSTAPTFKLLQRVQDANGFRATVRYIGPVCSSKQKDSVWLGVEFDDATRGKHDGTATSEQGETIRYFTCQHGGNGSFLKPSKVCFSCHDLSWAVVA
jgi:dynactin complex subunit